MRRVVDRLRRPQYTGENRCTPCTIANAAIALVVAVGVGLVYSRVAGALALVPCLAAIYLRGYLVPGTPALTERYLPARLTPEHPADSNARGNPVADAIGQTGTEATPEEILLATDAVRECEDGDDLCLADWFRRRWTGLIESIRETGSERGELSRLFDVPADAVGITEYGETVEVRVDDRRVGRWESAAGLTADLAAEKLLDDLYDDWGALGVDTRGEVLYSLRAFLDACPECGGPVTTERKTVGSCCSDYEFLVRLCQECGSQLVETEAESG